MKYDVIIVGGGIVGTACAFRLSSEGLKVALIEERFVASGTTAAGMGHIVVMDDTDNQFDLTTFSRKLWKELAPSLPSESEYENCGTLWVASDEFEMARAERKCAYYKERNCNARIIDKRELYNLEPNLTPGLEGAMLVKGDGVVYQLCAATYFAEKAIEQGTSLINGVKVTGISETEVLFENGGTLSGTAIINAAGFGAKSLSPELVIEAKKGHLVITDRYPGFVSHQTIELGYLESAHGSPDTSVAFNVQPRITGQLLIGSSRQPGVGNSEVEPRIVTKMLERAFAFMPKLKSLSAIRTWTGVRPSTPDNLPYIGRSVSNSNVIVAAGHEGLGITTSLGTAELVTDEVLGRESQIPRKAFSPGRFLPDQ